VLVDSEENEDLLDIAFNVLDFLTDDVETNSLGNGAALADSDDITGTDTESRGAMSSGSLMALLESVVLLDVMEVITTNDKCVLHLGGDNNTLEDSAANADIAGEGALFVDVMTFNSSLGSFEAYTIIHSR